nr:isochorismate synthase [Microbacterium sp. SORGH_AS_0421]
MSALAPLPGGASAIYRGSKRTVVAFGRRRADATGPVLQRIAAAHDDGVPLVLGSLGFDPSRDAHLIVPARVATTDTLREGVQARTAVAATAPRDVGLRFVPEPEAHVFGALVDEALDALRAGRLEKVVLARTLVADLPPDVPRAALVQALFDANPTAFGFAFDLGTTAEPCVFFGASPELLIRRVGTAVRSVPLAGSLPRSADPEVDRARAAALATSTKDLGEHRFVVDAIAAALGPFCRSLRVPDRPDVVATPTMWHLGTTIEGVLDDPTVTSAELALALHPTPAVGGVPTADAVAAIEALEPVPRGPFAGPVGWTDAAGDGEWALGIRSAEIAGRTIRLFAGAGIVADSEPEREIEETGAKFRTLLRALGAAEPVAQMSVSAVRGASAPASSEPGARTPVSQMSMSKSSAPSVEPVAFRSAAK